MTHFYARALLSLIFVYPFATKASPRTVETASEVLQKVSASPLHYRGRKVLSGYYSTEGCLYSNRQVAVVVLYCEAPKGFPARSIAVIEKNMGLLQFYEEKHRNELERVVRLRLFNGELQQHIPGDPESITIEQADGVFELLSNINYPACWSLGAGKGDGCYKQDKSEMTEWFKDNRRYLDDGGLWESVFSAVK